VARYWQNDEWIVDTYQERDAQAGYSAVMRRLYFLVPDIESGKKAVDEFLLAHIEWKHIHVIAKRGTPLEDLPEASFFQKSDIIPAMERAVPMGGATGMLCGLAALALEPHLVVAGGAILLATSLTGVGVGAWLGGMVGLNVGNTRLKRFEEAVEKGELLVMADVPQERVDEITERIKRVLPDAEPEGTEPHTPAFP
jgi:hypothetical protein